MLDSDEVTDVLEDPEQLSEVFSVDGEHKGLLWIAKAMALCIALSMIALCIALST